MPVAKDIPGVVFRNATAVLQARLVDAAGEPITPADLTSMKYSVLEYDPAEPNATVAITGHDDQSLILASHLFNTMQNDNAWTADEVGYNFRHEIDVSTDEAFPTAGVCYQVRYELTPTSGQKIVFRFQLRSL